MTRRRVPGLLAIVLLLATAHGAAAQLEALKKTTPEQRASIQTELMKAKLGLSAEEEAKVAALNLKYAEKTQPILTSDSGAFRMIREIRAVNDAKEVELKTLLTPAQFDAYLAWKDEFRQQFEQRIAAGQ